MTTPLTPEPPTDSGLTADDLARAKAQWRQDAPPEFKELLSAMSEDLPGTGER